MVIMLECIMTMLDRVYHIENNESIVSYRSAFIRQSNAGLMILLWQALRCAVPRGRKDRASLHARLHDLRARR